MATQTLDDTVVTLLSMGFELQDAQDAIQYGKIAVQEAVEWILAGKPGFADAGPSPPTLKLTDPVSRSSGGASGQHVQPSTSLHFPSTADASSSDTDMEQQVVSRLHLSDVKLAEKKQFEEKVRAEAERKAKLEKIQAKRERERVLKEIAEDRQITKMMRTYGPAKPDASLPDVSQPSGSTKCSSEASSNKTNTASQCSIQIRLPNGRQLRKKFDCAMTLGQLWLNILDEAGACIEGNHIFMQPFPRREFSAPEMNKTLEQLGLVPSGSLVVKKMDTNADAAEPKEEPVPVVSPEPEPVDERMHPDGEWEPVPQRGQHKWGQGRALEGEDPVVEGALDASTTDEESEEDEEMERERKVGARAHHWGAGRRLEGDEDIDMNAENHDNNNDDDDDDDNGGPPVANGAPEVNVNPFFPGMPGQLGGRFGGGVFGGFNRGAFMGVGQRLIPAGAPGADDHINRPVGDLAAEAAQQRLAQPAPNLPAEPRQPVIVHEIELLQDMSMAIVIDRITSPGSSVHSLGRLPENLSEKIIHHLLQQKLLDSKTLRLFLSSCLRKLVLDTYIYATNELLHAVRLHPTLQILSLHSCPLISDQGIQNIANLKNLKTLSLGVCKQITDKSLRVIAGFTRLQTLSLEETGVTDKGIIRYLVCIPCLRNLNLNRTAVTNAILPHLKNLEHLQLLFLEETKISSLEGMKDLTKLVSLNLASTAITADTLCHLVDHPSLTQLSLTNTENLMGDTALLYLAGLKLKTLCLPDRHTVTNAGLAHISGFHLHTLDLTNYIHVGDEGMEHVSKITTLQTLMLSNTRVTDAGLQLLKNLTHLQVFNVDRTCVSDAGVSVVKSFPYLSELSLSATNVTNYFLKEGVLHFCQGLTKLNLSRTHVGDKGVEKLKLPHLTLLNLDCTGVHARVVDTIKANCPSLKSVTTANLTPVLEEEEEED